MTRTNIKEDICHLNFVFVYRYAFSMYKMSYRTDIVNFLGGRLLEMGAYFEILLFGGALIRERRLLESGRLLDHLRYLQSVEKMWNFFGNFVVPILWNL